MCNDYKIWPLSFRIILQTKNKKTFSWFKNFLIYSSIFRIVKVLFVFVCFVWCVTTSVTWISDDSALQVKVFGGLQARLAQEWSPSLAWLWLCGFSWFCKQSLPYKGNVPLSSPSKKKKSITTIPPRATCLIKINSRHCYCEIFITYKDHLCNGKSNFFWN